MTSVLDGGGITGNEEADVAVKAGTTRPKPDAIIPPSRQQTKSTFPQTANHRWQDQVQSSQSASVHWRFSLTNTPEAITALNRLPWRIQVAITRMRVKAKTSRQIIDHLYLCLLQPRYTMSAYPRSHQMPQNKHTFRKQLLNHLKPEQHVSNKQQLHVAINILNTQTLRQYQELQHYTVFKTKC